METLLEEFLVQFEKKKHDLTVLRCVYVYGPSGSGKTRFVNTTLKKMGYDVVSYNAGDVRNKCIIDNINLSSANVSAMLRIGTIQKKIAVVMDEIECMNNGDKGGINALIKLVRPKKTKKQMTEEVTHTPIICIGNNHVDKKVAELMKCSLVIEIKKPSEELMLQVVRQVLPGMESFYPSILSYSEGDLKKLTNICNIVKKTGENVVEHFESRPLVEDSKQCVKRIFLSTPNLADHSMIQETDRTIVSMLWHENVADILAKVDKDKEKDRDKEKELETSSEVYLELIDNICFADYVDRITFQKQAWQMNEMSSIIKTFYVNRILAKHLTGKKKMGDVRFTKMLTKYSTEYNNSLFILKMSQVLGMDKKDMFAYILNARMTKTAEQIASAIGSEEVTAVDINRMFRFLDKFNSSES